MTPHDISDSGEPLREKVCVQGLSLRKEVLVTLVSRVSRLDYGDCFGSSR